MAKNQGWLVDWTQYLAARVGAMVLMAFDVDALLGGARRVGRLVYRWDRRHRERAESNIARSFPDWDARQVEQVGRGSMEHMAQLAVEVLYTPRALNRGRLGDRIHIRNMEPVFEQLDAGKPALLVTGHLGNWEVAAYLLALLGYDLSAIARPIDNPLVDEWLLGIRRRRGMKVITKWAATDPMKKAIREGGALAFAADQNAGDRGMFVPFFGRLASTYKSIGLLAMRYRVPIICGYGHRLGGRFSYEIGTVDAIYPEDWEGREDPLYYVTARYCRALEQMVRMKPEQYLWVHRRWKSRPVFERNGEPMPEKLKEQLRGLPWMDEQAIAELEADSAAGVGEERVSRGKRRRGGVKAGGRAEV